MEEGKKIIDALTDGDLEHAPSSNIVYDHSVNYNLHTKVVVKTADETVNGDDTLQNDDELLFAVAVSEVWTFRFILISLSGSTPDIKFAVTIPTNAAVKYALKGLNAASSFTEQVGRASAAALNVIGRGVTVGTHEEIVELFGTVTVGDTAGNVQLQWAQNTSNATDTKVLKNSCVIATKLA
jgi:hypothetical protein